MVMRESPVACITCLIRRNFMGFVLTEVPSYALGMRSPLTLDSTIIRRICGKVIPSIGVISGRNSTKFDCESSQKCRVSAQRGRKLGLTFHCGCFSLTAVLARMNRSRRPWTSPDAVGITSRENSFAAIMRSIIADLTQSQRVSARIIATHIRRGRRALSIRSRRAKVRTAH